MVRRGCLLVRSVPRFHGSLEPVHQTWTLFSASSFDCNFRPNDNQTFIVYEKCTLVLYRKGLCGFLRFRNSPGKTFDMERSVATISDQRESSTFCFPEQSALQGEKPMSNMMSWIFWDHLRPELFSPYSALYINSICPSSSSNSGPATTYSFSLVFASKNALPMSAPQTSRLFSLARNITSLRDLMETTPE